MLSLKLAEILGFDGALDLPSMLPSVEDAQCIFPSNMKLDVLSYFDVLSYLTWQPKAWPIKGSLAACLSLLLQKQHFSLRRTLLASFHSASRKNSYSRLKIWDDEQLLLCPRTCFTRKTQTLEG